MARDFDKDRQKRRIIENGTESAIDGSITPGLGKDESPIFGSRGGVSTNESVVVRRPHHGGKLRGGAKRIDPKSELGRRIVENALAGSPKVILAAPRPASPAQPSPRTPVPPSLKSPHPEQDERSGQAPKNVRFVTKKEYLKRKQEMDRLRKEKERKEREMRLRELGVQAAPGKKEPKVVRLATKKPISPRKKKLLQRTIEMIFGKRG